MARMNQGKAISMITIERICLILGCKSTDIFDFVVVEGENILNVEMVNRTKKVEKKDNPDN